MDLLHSWGVSLAIRLQTEYSAYESWFQLASSVADLHTTFFIFFPIWFHLKRDVSIKLIWVAVVGDWFNLVLKWILFGERPYWWVHETNFYGTEGVPVLRQVPITCETGPGISLTRCLQMVLWVLFGLVELLICMSRVYVAAHFPHQVISGVISGIIVAAIFSRQQWIYRASLQKYFNITLFLLVFAVGFYMLLKAVGVDLLWTLEKAQKWCENPAWVHMDTTPFASLLRNMGTLFGLGLGLHLPLYTKTKKSSNTPFRIGCIGLSVFILQLLDSMTFSSHNQVFFYLLSFTKSTVALLVPTTLVPGGISWFILGRNDKKNI
ncbi:glucose-6-phosphatase a, catalytic subunit, tandem duplicate 1 isoform X2 [Brachyhypopomus gauderio]|uniref:glucose-6-phosphatase a, catalytic subunit, tandem duplicate 1 isoform X2 n=1 Tax=Brachyhypopomus gauderio TaxID=698409 RepID=UPI004042C3A2